MPNTLHFTNLLGADLFKVYRQKQNFYFGRHILKLIISAHSIKGVHWPFISLIWNRIGWKENTIISNYSLHRKIHEFGKCKLITYILNSKISSQYTPSSLTRNCFIDCSPGLILAPSFWFVLMMDLDFLMEWSMMPWVLN